MSPYHSAILTAMLASAWILFGSITAAQPQSEADLINRIEAQLAAIEHLLPALRHVAVTTEEGSESKARLTSEAWFVPGDAVETPVKVVLMEADGQERRETAFWLDQGRLFFVRERIETFGTSGSEVTERQRSYDGFHLFRLESRKATFGTGQPIDFASQPFAKLDLPADAETEGSSLEEIALETASELAPVVISNRPVRW